MNLSSQKGKFVFKFICKSHAQLLPFYCKIFTRSMRFCYRNVSKFLHFCMGDLFAYGGYTSTAQLLHPLTDFHQIFLHGCNCMKFITWTTYNLTLNINCPSKWDSSTQLLPWPILSRDDESSWKGYLGPHILLKEYAAKNNAGRSANRLVVIILDSEYGRSGFESWYARYTTLLSNAPGLDCFLVIREVIFLGMLVG